MKKLILLAAFVFASASYAAAQTSEGTTTSATTNTTTELALNDSKDIPKKQKLNRKERKAAAAQEASKSVKISIPVPDISKSTFPKEGNE